MKCHGQGLPSNAKKAPRRCACGRELVLVKTNEGYLMKECPCGRKEWSITAGLWRGYDDKLFFLYPVEPDAPDSRD